MQPVTQVVLAVYAVLCLALVGVVLFQKGSGGIGTALGGQAVEAALGTRSAEVSRKLTAAGAALFVVLTIVLGELVQHDALRTAAGS